MKVTITFDIAPPTTGQVLTGTKSAWVTLADVIQSLASNPNVTVVSVDPLGDAKEKAAAGADTLKNLWEAVGKPLVAEAQGFSQRKRDHDTWSQHTDKP